MEIIIIMVWRWRGDLNTIAGTGGLGGGGGGGYKNGGLIKEQMKGMAPMLERMMRL